MEKKNIVDFRGARQKTKNWSPEKKFREFSSIRVPKLLRALKTFKIYLLFITLKLKWLYIPRLRKEKF